MNSFFERWGIEQSDEDAWHEFINRLLAIIGDSSAKYISMNTSDIQGIAFSLGKPVDSSIHRPSVYKPDRYLKLTELINPYRSVPEIARSLEAILEHLSSTKATLVKTLVDKSTVGFRLVKSKNQWLAYPSNEPLLDEALVERPLKLLEGAALIEYRDALAGYGKGDWVKAAEKSRRTLEEVMRQFLSRPKIGLNAAIKEVGRLLKNRPDLPEHLRILIVNNLRSLDDNFNESSKHASKTTESEAEYLIYQVGLNTRLIMRILHST